MRGHWPRLCCRLSLCGFGGRSGSCQRGTREAAGNLDGHLISPRRPGNSQGNCPDDHANRRRRSRRLETQRQELRGDDPRLTRPGPQGDRCDRRRRALARQACSGNLQAGERQAHTLHGRSRSTQAPRVQGREGVRAHADGLHAARRAGQAVSVIPSPGPSGWPFASLPEIARSHSGASSWA